MQYNWNIPDEIEKNVEVRSLSNDDLFFYHGQMHIFWDKIKDGRYFGQSSDDGWTFEDVYITHKQVVIEMLKRGLKHIFPINSLDHTDLANNINELLSIINSIKK